MNTDEHELKDLLARGEIDKKKLCEGFLKGKISSVFIKHSYHRNKEGFYEYKKDVFEVKLDEKDYLLSNKENVDEDEQQKYSSVLRIWSDKECQKLLGDLDRHTFIPIISASADKFPVDGMKIMREMGVLDE